jgi:hypothetical protein
MVPPLRFRYEARRADLINIRDWRWLSFDPNPSRSGLPGER